MDSTQIKFSIKNPSDSTIADIITDAITFMPAFEQGECEVNEGGVFDRKIGMSDTCDFVCLAPCSGLGFTPSCNAVSRCEGSAGDETFASCSNNSCECDLDSMPDKDALHATSYMTATCTPNSMELRVNKCVINKFGFTLIDLYINGPTKTDNFDDLETSVQNTCRGQLAFDNGPEYVFKIDRTLSDCRTQKGIMNGEATYVNAIQGVSGHTIGQITRQKDILINFGCKFALDMTLSVGLGNVAAQSYQAQLATETATLDVAMAVYEDESFTKVSDNGISVAVPDHVYIGVVGTDIGNFQVIAENCYVTSGNDPSSSVRYNVLTNGCADAADADNINVIENGSSNQARFSFASFEFVGDNSGQLYAHCDVRICDPNNETCEPTCGSRRRRNGDETMRTQFSFAINVSGSESSTRKDCTDGVCFNV